MLMCRLIWRLSCKRERKQIVFGYAECSRQSMKLIVVQVRAETNYIWLCRVQPAINEINCRASESRNKLYLVMPSAADNQ